MFWNYSSDVGFGGHSTQLSLGMAGSGASEKKSSEGLNDVSMFNADNMQSNMKVIYYSRTFLSIIGGVIAGILGFTGLTGFIFYFLVMAITSVALAAKAKFSIHTYFDSWNRILLDGFFGGLMPIKQEPGKNLEPVYIVRAVLDVSFLLFELMFSVQRTYMFWTR
ncbi:hypothetical protein Cgig2_026053 [Carnegiea gigantea]|uniref:ER membrane protein complex subunit 6 n=1 Tax=Carnegiea gigantea TaxID=171969 RepID=A0A9Q1QL91_9CARY|nr:hypothetical protein Cgig2_026053 [Carnegiea gigantea]